MCRKTTPREKASPMIVG